jgi:hypothetical protein
MITAEQIPDEAAWKLQDRLCTDVSVEQCRAAIAAALAEWPGATDSGLTFEGRTTSVFILPLPQEPRT